MGLFDSLFGTPDPPKAPDYSPLINQAGSIASTAQGNNQTALGLTSQNTARTPAEDANSAWAQEQAQASAQLQQEQFNWAKDIYAQNKGQTDQIVNMFTNQAANNFANANADRARYDSSYVPLQQQQVDEANNYNTAERRDLMRGRAISDVSQQFDAQRENTMRDLESFGINPGAVRYAALDTGYRAAQAAAQAAAANQSDLATEQTARDLRDKAIAQGNLLPGQAAGEAGVGINAGTGAANTALAQTASGAAIMGKPTDYAQIAQGYQNTGTSSFNAGTGSQNAGTSALGAGNSALGAASSATNSGMSGTNAGFQNQQTTYEDQVKQSSGIGKIAGLAGSAAMNYFAPGSSKFAEGGEVPLEASPSGGKQVDDVAARLTPGEFVMPKDVASWLGEEKLHGIIRKAREALANKGAKPQVRRALPQAPSFRSALPTG
ncbi:MAG: hypothetical protein ACXVCT_10610 [Ktedonobacterales bacterium]